MKLLTLLNFLYEQKDTVHHIELFAKARVLTIKVVDKAGFSGSMDVTDELLKAEMDDDIVFGKIKEFIFKQISDKRGGKYKASENPKLDKPKGDQYTSHDDANPYYIYRFPDGVTINPREFLLDTNQNLRGFSDVGQILSLLGFSSEKELEENGYYIITKKELDDEG